MSSCGNVKRSAHFYNTQKLIELAYLRCLPVNTAKPADRVLNGQPIQENNYFFLDFLAGLVLTFSFRAAPALNLTSVEAAILIASPFAGLRPVLAALSPTSTLNTPGNTILSQYPTADTSPPPDTVHTSHGVKDLHQTLHTRL